MHLGDILICSENEKDHREHIRKILQILREHKFFVKLSEYTFCARKVEYLGFVLKGNVFVTNPHKSSAVESWETQIFKRDVRSLHNYSPHLCYGQLYTPFG